MGSNRQPTHDEIAVRAYELWEQRHRPEGYDVEFWLEAERQLLSGVNLYQEQKTVSPQTQSRRGSRSEVKVRDETRHRPHRPTAALVRVS